MTMLDHALAASRMGLRVFPCQPLTKLPAKGCRWKAEATQDEGQIAAWWRDTPDANIGVVADGMIIVDEDNKDGKPGAFEFDLLDIDPETYTTATPNGGLHHFYAHAGRVSQRAIGEGLDVRVSGVGYVIAAGSKLPTGEYRVVKDLPVLPAPQALVERCGKPRDPAADPRQPVAELNTEANIQRVIEYLAYFAKPAVQGERGDDQAYLTACRAKDLGVSDGVCLDLMLEHYNDRCDPPWEPERLEAKVTSAYTNGQNPPGSDTPEAHFAGVDVPSPEYKPKPPRGKIIWAGDDDDEDEEWALFERLPRRGTAMLVAPTNSGKTFISYELGRCMATGDKFFGVEPDYRCGTLILAGEGLSGARKRMKALKNLPIGVLPSGSLGDAENVKALVADIEDAKAQMELVHGVPLGVIVIDTLTAVGLLQDENNNSECGAAVKALEGLSLRFDCLVVVNHHPPKNGTGARGGGALPAGFDTVMEIFWDGKSPVRFMECTKSREGRTGSWGAFTLASITVGHDKRGRAKTTCEVSMSSEVYTPPTKEPPKYDRLALAIETARLKVNLGAREPVPRAAVRAAFGDVSGITDRGNATRAFDKCIDHALALGSIRMPHGRDGLIDDRPMKEE